MFSGVCLSKFGGGYPIQLMGGPPFQVWMEEGPPSFLTGGHPRPGLDGGYPPGQD